MTVRLTYCLIKKQSNKNIYETLNNEEEYVPIAYKPMGEDSIYWFNTDTEIIQEYLEDDTSLFILNEYDMIIGTIRIKQLKEKIIVCKKYLILKFL